MNDQKHPAEDTGIGGWEEKINALLDGELDPEASEDLKWAATNDQDLARAIVDAYQLQRAMEHVQTEKAPASLTRRLKKIPRQHRPVYLQPRWAMAFAVVPLMLIGVALMRSQEAPMVSVPAPGLASAPVSQDDAELAKIEEARKDLAVAFAYIDRVSDRTSNLIESEVGGEMSDAVAGSIFKTIQHQNIL